MFGDIELYILGLADNWAAFITGGTLAALILVIERLWRRTIPVRSFVALFLVFGFVAASFQTWRHEHAARLVAEQSPHRGRDAATVARLQEYYAVAVSLYRDASTANTDEEFQKAKKQTEDWAQEVGEWITNNMGNGAYAKLIQLPKPFPTTNDVKPDRVNTIIMLTVMRDNLEKLVENPAWDKP